MKQTQLMLIGIVVVLLGGGAFFLAGRIGDKNTTKGEYLSPTPEIMMEKTPGTEGTMKEATKSFAITGNNFSYDTKEIKVNKGDTVVINFKNQEGFHDWNLDEFNAHTEKIQAGLDETVTFIADKTGTFEYYCSVGEHRAMGMVGNLIVQ